MDQFGSQVTAAPCQTASKFLQGGWSLYATSIIYQNPCQMGTEAKVKKKMDIKIKAASGPWGLWMGRVRGVGSLELHLLSFQPQNNRNITHLKRKNGKQQWWDWEHAVKHTQIKEGKKNKPKQQPQLIQGWGGEEGRDRVSQTIIKMERVPEISCYSKVQHKHLKEKLPEPIRNHQSAKRPTAAFNRVKK